METADSDYDRYHPLTYFVDLGRLLPTRQFVRVAGPFHGTCVHVVVLGLFHYFPGLVQTSRPQ